MRSGDGVLSIKPFSALWIALSLSSLGDWLSILALLALAPSVTHGSNLAKTSSISGVWVVTLLPALLLGPIAGALADRFDRRVTMVVGDVIRGLLFISIPLFPNLTWIFVAKFLAGIASQFWNPAAAASIPNLVPKEKLERANQLSQLMTYGTAPLAAALLAVLGYIATGLGHVIPFFHANKLDLALYFNGASYFVSAITVYFLRQIGKREHSGRISVPSTAKAIWEGWRFIRHTPVVRGLVIGMTRRVLRGRRGDRPRPLLHPVHAERRVGRVQPRLRGDPDRPGDRHGIRSRPFGDFSRRRLFGVTLTASAIPLAMIALVPNLAIVTLFVFLMGVISGIAYPTGFTIVGLEVDDHTRGRVFAFFQSTIQAILLAVIAVAGFIATGFSAAIGALSGSKNGAVNIAHITYGSPGDNLLLLLSAVLVAFVGIQSYRQLDDRRGVPLFEDLWAAIRNEPLKRMPAPPPPAGHPAHGPAGLFLAFEGGEGVGKTTQARLIAIWLREQGYDVVTTNEPGATKVGMRLRALLLDTAHAGMSPHSEALLYAADRAEHVAKVIDPALERGAVVITDLVHRLLTRLPGRGAGHPDGGYRAAEQLGHRRADTRPHGAARHAAGDRAKPACPLGRPDRGRAA